MGNLSLPTNTKPEEISGYTPITEGRYHCLIVDVQSGMTKTGKPYDRVKLQILAGRNVRHRMGLPPVATNPLEQSLRSWL